MKVAAAPPRRRRRAAGQHHLRAPSRRTPGPTSGRCTSRCSSPASSREGHRANKLGYVYAFPIPQTIANINAFQLGAQSVNPDAETYVVNTSNWCDPAKQAEAASSLIAQGVDVITQHQDCTATITKAAEEAGIKVVGYHADASELAPEGWVTGSEWAWGELYNDIVETSLAGEFTGSPYNANFRVGYKDGENPFVQSEYGPMVDEETRR